MPKSDATSESEAKDTPNLTLGYATARLGLTLEFPAAVGKKKAGGTSKTQKNLHPALTATAAHSHEVRAGLVGGWGLGQAGVLGASVFL